MTSTEFICLAGSCVGESEWRPSMRSAFYWGGTAIIDCVVFCIMLLLFGIGLGIYYFITH